MAIRPVDVYPGQTLSSDAGYPDGKARNEVVPGDGVGTPLEETWVNDLWGFLQAILDEAGVTASGAPDEVGASQYLDALQALRFDSNGLAIVKPIDLIVRKRLSLAGATPQGLGSVSPSWEHIIDTVMVWRSKANAQRLIWGLNAYIAEVATAAASTVGLRGLEIDAVTVQMLPGNSRTGTNRMQVQLVQSRFETGVLTENVIASDYGVSGSASLDTLTLSGIAHVCDPIADYSIRVHSGNDGASNQDKVYGGLVQFKPVKLPL